MKYPHSLLKIQQVLLYDGNTYSLTNEWHCPFSKYKLQVIF
jgi:hypothetical protein